MEKLNYCCALATTAFTEAYEKVLITLASKWRASKQPPMISMHWPLLRRSQRRENSPSACMAN
jgi:hypothetical protein